MAGDFILAVASMMIARLKDNDVTLTLSQVSSSLNTVCLSHRSERKSKVFLMDGHSSTLNVMNNS